jgi:hypothetical protein
MRGRIKSVGPTSAFISGEDGRDYFFVYEEDYLFSDRDVHGIELAVGARVNFEAVGSRARDIVYIEGAR